MEQADLFDSLSFRYKQPKTQKNDFLSKHMLTLRFDQILILSIILVMAFALIFSFGVERGKKGALAEVNALRAKYQEAMDHLGPRAFDRLKPKNEVKPQIGSPAANPEAVRAEDPSVEVISIATEPADKTDEKAEEEEPSTPPKGIVKGQYTIQMVTYKTEKQAHRLIDKLTAIGHKTFLIPSGKYIQVCLEAFESKQSANKAMKRFKVDGLIPTDAYVRTFPR